MLGHPNEDQLRRGYEAFANGDMDTLVSLWTDDIVWHSPGRSPLAGDYKGAEEILGLFAQLVERSGGTFSVELHDVLANDTHGVGLSVGRAERNGKTLETKDAIVFHFRGDKISEVWLQSFDQYAGDEFWSD